MMNKWRNFPRILSLFLQILCWLLLLGSLFYGIMAARQCVFLLSDQNTGETFVSGITLDYMRFYSDTGGISITSDAMLKMNCVSLAVYFIQIPLICLGIHWLRKILAPIVQNRPFTGTAKILTKLGWLSLVVAAVQNITHWGMLRVSEYHFMLSKLFLGSVITKVSFQFQPELTFFITSIVFFLLSYVFRHGEALQQLSDETL